MYSNVRHSLILATLVLLITLSLTMLVQAQEPITLTDEQGQYPLGLHLDILEDSSGQLTIDEVSSTEFEAQFVGSQEKVPNFGYSQSAFWVRFWVSNNTNKATDWLLEISDPTIDSLDLFLSQPTTQNQPAGRPFTAKHTGDLLPFVNRDVDHHNFIFKLSLEPQASYIIYLRVKNRGSTPLPLTLWSPDTFAQQNYHAQFIFGFYYGFIFIMVCYNLFLFFFLREKAYLYYVLSMGSMGLYQLSLEGFASQYLWPNQIWWGDIAILVFIGLTLLNGTTFISHFLQIKTYQPILDKILTLLKIISTLLIILSLFPANYRLVAPLMAILTVMAVLIGISSGVVSWRHGYKPARYFLLAWGGIFGGAILVVLGLFGILPLGFFTEYGLRIGVFLLVLLLAIALADRINVLKAETETTNKRLRENESRLTQFLEAMPVGISVVDSNAKTYYTNQHAKQIFNYQNQDEQPEVTLEEIMADFSFTVLGTEQEYPLERNPLIRALRGAWANEDDIEIIKPDKTRIPLEIWASPIFDEQGQISYAISAFQDITRRKQTEAELNKYRLNLEEMVAKRIEEARKAKETAQTANAALTALTAVAFTVNNSLDLEANLENALEIILREMNLNHAWLLLSEDNGRLLRLVATQGLPDDFCRQEALTPVDRCFCGEVLLSGKLRCYFEEGACLRLTQYLEQHPTLSSQHISLPVVTKQKIVGLLNLGGANVVNLTPDNYEWLESVTQQIGNAIENAMLYQNTLSKAERLTTLNRVSTIVSLLWKLDRVLPPLMAEMARILEISLGVLVLRSQKNQNRYRVRTRFGRWQSPATFNAVVWHKLPLLKIIKQTQAPLLIPHATQDKRLKPLSTLIEQENIQTALTLPLAVQNQLIGFIQLYAIGRERIFEATEIELARTLANQAAVAIEKARLYEATVTRYEQELEMARQIQQNLLPHIVPKIPGLRIAGLCRSAYATGGDFYDYIPLPNHQLGIVVGDVTGKSLPAAMVMAMARNTIRAELVNHPQPAEAMTAANDWLCRDIQRGTFVATVQALIDPREPSMWLVNAGQTATLLVRDGQSAYLLPDEAVGFPLGIQPNTTYTQAKIPLQTDDILLFYTDGIVEAKNTTGDMFGFDRLESFMQNIHHNHDPHQIINDLLAEMQTFVGQAEQHDDITLVVVQVK